MTATASGMALAGMLSAVFGVMLEPMQQDLGWSRAEISTGPLVVSIMGVFLAAPAGHMIDRWGTRLTGTLVVLVTFSAILAMSLVGHHIWQWWAAWSLFGIAGAFAGTVWLAPVSTIFDKGRGMAIAVTIAGASISAACGPLIAEYFLQAHGWRYAFVALGCIWCGLTLPLVIAFMPGSRRVGKSRGDSTNQLPEMPEAGGFTPRQGFRSVSFYLIFAGALASGLTGLSLIVNLVPILTFTGLTRTQAVGVAGVAGIASFGGRLVSGWLMDNYDIRKLAITGAVLSTIFPITLLLAPGIIWAAMAGLAFHGLVGGLRISALVYLTSRYLGARSFGLFYGAISTSMAMASGIGPLAANYVYDHTQSYLPAIWAAVPGFLLTSLCFAALGPAPDFSHPARAR